MRLNPENGSITLPGGNTIAAHAVLADLAALYPHVHPLCPCAGTVHFGLSFADKFQQYTVTARFEQQRLDSVSVFFCPVGEDNSWEAWTEARELQRRQEFDPLAGPAARQRALHRSNIGRRQMPPLHVEQRRCVLPKTRRRHGGCRQLPPMKHEGKP